MTIKYLDSKRLSGLSTDSGYTANIITINHRCSTTDDHAYADLGSNLSNTSWTMRYKMVISGLSSSSSNPNNAYLFAISKTTTNNMSDQSLGLRMMVGGGSGYLEVSTGGGTTTQNSGEGYTGSAFSTVVANATWYVESIRNGSSFSVRITTSSDYTGGELQTWSTSGTVEDLRYIKYTNRDDNSSGHVLVSTISDIKIYDGVTSATGSFVRDGTWTASASNKVTVASTSVDTKPTNVQDNSILVEKDTTRRYWFDAEVSYTDEAITWDSTTAVNVSSSGNTATATGSSAWDKVIRSTQTWTPSDEPTLEFTIAIGGGVFNQMNGFGKGTLGSSYQSLDYALYTESTLGVYESGVQKYTDSSTTPSSSDTFKVTMDSNGLVKYWRNGSVFYTSAQTASGTYYAQFTPKTLGESTTVNYSSTTPSTWTMEPTFRDEYTGGWITNSGTGVAVSGGEVTWNVAGNQSNQISKAIGSTLSDTAWVAQFEVELSAYSSGEANILALSSGTAVTAQNSTDDTILVRFADTGKYNVSFRTGNGTDYSYVSTIDKPANGTRHYITLVRNSSTEAILYVRTGSHSGTQVTNSPHTVTQSTMSGATGLDTVTQGGWNTGNSGRTLTMVGDNLKIYNGVTSIN